jgi:hypothetical protein
MGRFPDISTGYCRRAGLSIADPVCRDPQNSFNQNSFIQRDPRLTRITAASGADDTAN